MAQTQTDIDASNEIYRLAQLHGLEHVELARECQYHGTVNGRAICVSVFDRNPAADLEALRSALAS